MRNKRQSTFLVTLVFALLFAFTIPGFAFPNLAGLWEQFDLTDPSCKTKVVVTQGTNGEILSLSGFIYFLTDFFSGSYIKTNYWFCDTQNASFTWNLGITEKIDYLMTTVTGWFR